MGGVLTDGIDWLIQIRTARMCQLFAFGSVLITDHAENRPLTCGKDRTTIYYSLITAISYFIGKWSKIFNKHSLPLKRNITYVIDIMHLILFQTENIYQHKHSLRLFAFVAISAPYIAWSMNCVLYTQSTLPHNNAHKRKVQYISIM